MHSSPLIPLTKLSKGQSAIVRRIDEKLLPCDLALIEGELERRILEIGVIEGSELAVLQFGLIKRDPIAIKVNNSHTIAIRRNEAASILVEPLGTP